MGTDFSGHHLSRYRRVAPLLRGAKEVVVSHREQKRNQALEVRRVFETNRIAQACLARAYECLVPIARRTVFRVPSQCGDAQNRDPGERRRVGGSQ